MVNAFSDVFEEGGILPSPFHGGFGLVTINGTPKPAYRAFQLMHGAGAERLPVSSTGGSLNGCNDTGVLATRNATHARLFVFNHPLSSSTPGHTCIATLTVSSSDDTQSLQDAPVAMARIDNSTTNPQQAWVQMGSPIYPTQEQLSQLEQASQIHWTEDAMLKGEIPVRVPSDGLLVLDVAL